MHDPVRMVFVNVIASLALFLGIIIYKYIYPKKNINLLLLLIMISSLVCINIFRPGAYESGDFNIHLYRSIAFYNSLQEGNFFPSWAGELNATYGYPLFIFNYSLPYYIISFFHFMGFSFIMSMKFFLMFNYLFSGIFMFIFAKSLFKNNLAAFTAAIFYQFAPYHLIDLNFKVVIGEILTFTLLPLLFYCSQKLWERKNSLWFALASLSTALLIMSHVVLALFSMLIIFAYSLYKTITTKKKSYILSTMFSLLLGCLCSLFVWLTPFFLTQYTVFKQVETFVYFPTIRELLFAPWRYGFLFQGPHGELSYLIGYTHILAAVTIFILLIHNKLSKNDKKDSTFWLVTLLLMVFLITSFSISFWGILPFLKAAGSHRLLLIVAFIISILAGYLVMHFKKRKTIISFVIFITILSTILNWGHRQVHPEITDQTLIANLETSTANGEGHFYANPKWRNPKEPWFKLSPKNHLEITKGSAEIKDVKRNTTVHTYVISSKTDVILKENTVYFPGWRGFDNGKQIEVKPDKNGIISLHLTKGLHLLEIQYKDIFVYKVLKTMSVVGFLLTIAIIVLPFLLTRFSSKNK